MGAKAGNRLEFLDNLRGLAALYVLFFHIFRSPSPNLTPPEQLIPFLMHGASGVVLFFVISAFSLCLTMPRHEQTGSPTLSFAVSRFFRIAPLFYVLMIYQVVAAYLIHGWSTDPFLLFGQVLFVFNLVPDWIRSNVPGGWTIGVEMLFYAMFPIFYFHLPKWWQKAGVLAVSLAASYTFTSHMGGLFGDEEQFEAYVATSIIVHFPTFILGTLAFEAYRVFNSHRAANAIGRSILIVGAALFVGQFSGVLRSALVLPTHISALSYVAILLGASLASPPFLRSEVLSFYGKISYSLYLWHIPVISLLTPWLQQISGSGYSPWITFPVAAMIALGGSTLAATLSYRFIEQPGEALGKALLIALLNRPIHSAA